MSNKINLQDGNIKSVVYNDAAETMTVIFGGGSKWLYTHVKPEAFAIMLANTTGIAVLDEIRHNNLVGIRLR